MMRTLRSNNPSSLWESKRFSILCLSFFFATLFLFVCISSAPIFAQATAASPNPADAAPTKTSCQAGLKLFEPPFFKICYPARWHVIHGFGEDYAWWVFSKRKHGEQFDKPYIRIIISKGIAQLHLATQIDSIVLGERTYTKATNQFKDLNGKRLNKRYWREIAVGPEFDILAWYEQIKEKDLKRFDRALDSFWVPAPPHLKPEKPEK
jgi:hypothetical protein